MNAQDVVRVHFHGRGGVTMDEFPSLFNRYVRAWAKCQKPRDIEELQEEAHELYSRHVNVSRETIILLCKQQTLDIPTEILQDMRLAMCRHPVERVQVIEETILVRDDQLS
jgi:hypothetical protein